MATKEYTGSLAHKRKSDLIDLAQALGLETAGLTRPDLQDDIRQHLVRNETVLRADPAFAGLFSSGRRSRKSVAPISISPSRSAASALEEDDDDAPATKHSQVASSQSPSADDDGEEDTKPVIHPVPAPLTTAGAVVPASPRQVARYVEQETEVAVQSAERAVARVREEVTWVIEALREWLTDARVLVNLALLVELGFIFSALIPTFTTSVLIPHTSHFRPTHLPTALHPRKDLTLQLRVPYLPSLFHPQTLATLQSYILHSLALPLTASYLINFDRARVDRPRRTLSPLSFALVRLALLHAWQDERVAAVLPRNVQSAVSALAVAFAFYEAVAVRA